MSEKCLLDQWRDMAHPLPSHLVQASDLLQQ